MIDLAREIPAAPGLVLTDEMKAILDHEPVSPLVVEAGAGTGKTTLLTQYARKWKKRGLYISYNAAIAKEAQSRFPDNIDAMTAHGYAYRAQNVSRHKGRLTGKIRKNHVREAGFDLVNPFMSEDRMMKCIVAGIQNFTNSAGSTLTEQHCELEFAPKQTRERVMPIIAKAVLAFVKYEESSLPFTHDCYLKNLEMSGGMGAEYEYILVDEAQDLNPILLSLVRKSGRPVIMVGDRKQSIYAFRGSIDAMSEVDAPRLPLSQSWRFGSPVDAVANHILSYTMDPPDWKLKGKPDHVTEIEEYKGIAPRESLILARTNSRIFEGLVSIKVPFHVIGGFETIATQLLSALALSRGDRREIRDPLIQSYNNWDDMVADSEDDDDPDVRRLVKIVKEYGDSLIGIIQRLRQLHSPHRGAAAIVLSTAHKAKGLEAEHVILLDDFPTPAELEARRVEHKITQVEYDQEFHLLYVAVTRAMTTLKLSGPLFYAFERPILEKAA